MKLIISLLFLCCTTSYAATDLERDIRVTENYTEIYLEFGGIIENSNDVDNFIIDYGAEGTLYVRVVPAWDLDVLVTLTAPDGTVTIYDNPDDTEVIFVTDIVAGVYILSVWYTTEYSQGEYDVFVNFTPVEPPPPSVFIELDVTSQRQKKGMIDVNLSWNVIPDYNEVDVYIRDVPTRTANDGQYSFTTKRKGGFSVRVCTTNGDICSDTQFVQ